MKAATLLVFAVLGRHLMLREERTPQSLKPKGRLPRRRVRQAAVDGKGGAGGRGLARGEKEHGVGHMFGRHARLEQVARAVVLLEAGFVEATGPHAVGANRGPEARLA